MLKIAVTFNRSNGQPGLTKFNAPLSKATVKEFTPDPLNVDLAIRELGALGFKVTTRGAMSVSVRGTRAQFEKAFGTHLSKVDLPSHQPYAYHSFFYPAQGASWKPEPALTTLIDDAYIQWPHIYLATAAKPLQLKKKPKVGPSAVPPHVSYFHLVAPNGISTVLNASKVHAEGTTGAGVKVVMVDSGFAHAAHPFFKANGYSSTVDLAPNATNDKTDLNGHGTGESANVFSIAPGATFIGVKVDNDNDPQVGASLLEGFQRALEHQPNVISVSMGYDLSDAGRRFQLSELPNSLAALEAEVQNAVASGVTVVFSAGNGHFSFPGMLPDVISAGGVFVDEEGEMQASDYASAFESKIYSGRHVPDFCGLVGMQPHAAYLMLPVPSGCEIDREESQPNDGQAGDGTKPSDGWGVFSGTSAAAPQLAGLCALLLQKNPGLTPSDIKAVLRRTSRDVTAGQSNPASSDDGVPMAASLGDDGATGAGLADAFEAWKQV